MKTTLIALLLTLPLTAQNAAVDVLHYRIEIALPATGTEIVASTELTVRPLRTPLETLVLDFSGLTIDSVTVNGAARAFQREGERLSIPVGTQTGEPFRVLVRYHGSPLDGLFIRPNKLGDRSAFADNWPNRAHAWFPAVDHPSDKATVEEIVTAPEGFEVIGNGTRVESVSLQNGFKRTRWSESTPIPVHCMVIGATNFSIVRAGVSNGVEVLYYLYPADAKHGALEMSRAPQILAFFSDLIGPYPYDKLALVQSSTRFGGMENSSAIFLDEKVIDGKGTIESLIAHEIAHQWFGDSITQRDWHDVWLSEGFATYFAALYFEHASGRQVFLDRMSKARERYLNANRKQSRPINDPAITDLFKMLNALTYQKSSWVLHMLRGIMGDPAFFAAIRDFYEANRDGNASTGELRVVMERHAGQPLDWFFRQWIFEAGHPLFALDWTWSDGKLVVRVEQMQKEGVFRVPLTIAIGDTRESVVIDERVERFEFAREARPASVVLDPDEWVLKEMAGSKDERSDGTNGTNGTDGTDGTDGIRSSSVPFVP